MRVDQYVAGTFSRPYFTDSFEWKDGWFMPCRCEQPHAGKGLCPACGGARLNGEEEKLLKESQERMESHVGKSD